MRSRPAAPRPARSSATRRRPTTCATSASSPRPATSATRARSAPALEGVERAYLVSPISPMQSEFEQAFLETAKEAGVKHIVKLS